MLTYQNLPVLEIHTLYLSCLCLNYKYNCPIIPAKAFARDYGITGVRLSVCLSVTTITK